MAVVDVAKDALGGMSKLAAVPNGQIQFVNYKNAFLAPTNTHHLVEFRLASGANVALRHPSRNNYVLERRILFVRVRAKIVLIVTTDDLASVSPADPIGDPLVAELPKIIDFIFYC